MSGSIQIPYAVGSKAWWARVNLDTEWITCPACNGTLRHSVTLGNGETHVVWCCECGAERMYDYDYSHDREGPVGKVRRHPVRATVEDVTLASVEIRGDEVNYYSEANGNCRYIYKCEGLFATEAEARAYAETVLVPKAQAEEVERLRMSLHPGRVKERAKKAARDAAWWRKKRAEQVELLERIDRRIARLKGAKS